MEKVPLWKRVGGWLQRSHGPVGGGDVVRVDAEGLLIVPENKDENDQDALAHPNKNEHQITVIEEGFGRLIDALESINENMVQQRQHGQEMKNQLQQLCQSLQNLPGSAEDQQAIKGLTEELRNQSIRSQQLAETISALPDLTQAQVDKLSDITRQLDASAEAQMHMAEAFKRLDNNTKGISESNKAQAVSLANVGTLLERDGQRLHEILTRQNRRLIGIFVIFIGLTLAAAAAVALLLLKTS